MYLPTITTCLHLNGKLDQTIKCLDSLFMYEPTLSEKLVLVNEYNIDADRFLNEIKKRYTGIRCIQKVADEIGQASSVNKILNMLREGNYKYWIHFEESWETCDKFLNESLDIMERNSDIGQLQIAKGWDGYTDIPHDLYKGEVYIKENKIEEVEKSLGVVPVKHARWKKHPWPFYSLQPGIDRVDVTSNIGDFYANQNQNPKGKVDGSEFNFSHRWFCKGYKKAVLYPYRITRQKFHTSTKQLLLGVSI